MKNIAITSDEQATMSSLDLLSMVNEARAENGEKAITRLNDFHARVADELEGEFYESFVKPSSANGGRPTTGYWLTRDQCMLVAMRESKSVRRSVLAKLKAAESGKAVPNSAATLALVECAANLLRASDSGRVVMLQKAGEAIGADTSFLPAYTQDSANGHIGAMNTYSLTHLLAEFGYSIQASVVNRKLEAAGLLEYRTRKSVKRGNLKRFWCITDAGLAYGKNVVSPQSPRETQPHWYRETFSALLAAAGIEGV